MHNVVAVEERYRSRNVAHVVARLVLREDLFPLDALKQLSAREQLHHYVHVARVAAHVHQLHNVGVSCGGGKSRAQKSVSSCLKEARIITLFVPDTQHQ